MKRGLLALCAMLSWLAAAQAQVEFRCRIVNSRVLQFESIPVEVMIANNSGRSLTLDARGGDARLLFDVESSPGVLVMPTGVPLVTNRITVRHAENTRFVVDLLPSYGISSTGPYSITARLELGDKVFVGAKMYVDVLPGLEIARLAGGVPGLAGSTRVYSLRTLNRDRSERVFLRIQDDSGQCHGVLDLGRIVRVYQPVLHIDEEGNVQVLHQNGPGSFVRHVVTPYGRIVSQEAYTSDGGNLRLKAAASPDASGALSPAAIRRLARRWDSTTSGWATLVTGAHSRKAPVYLRSGTAAGG